MTMATLASNLSRQGYGSVEDATGLPGKYDIALTWTPEPPPALQAGNASAAQGGGAISDVPAPEASSLFTAVRETLGLRLTHRQIQVQFLVIDRIERNPTGN